MEWSVGVDIGATKTNIAAVGADGTLFQKKQKPSENNYQTFVTTIATTVQELVRDYSTKPLGVGVGVAGEVNARDGSVACVPNLDWHQLPLQADLEEQLQMPVKVLNDVRAAALAEWRYGAGKGSHHFACVFVGTGIGGGIVCNGQLLAGASNTAGELGHMVVYAEGRKCTCGSWGCMEAYAGGWAIAQQAQARESSLILKLAEGRKERITARIVIEAYRQGDSTAIEIIEQAKLALVSGTISIIHTLNPERVIFGGGIIQGCPEMVQWIDIAVRPRLLSTAAIPLTILPAKFVSDAGVIGAATAALPHEAVG